jgi:hypothetical protein
MRSPWGLAVTGAKLYVVSTGEDKVQVFDDTLSPCPAVNFGTGGGINPPPSGGGGAAAASDRAKPKLKLTGVPRGCARHNFAFTIHASDDVLLKRLTLFINHRRLRTKSRTGRSGMSE